jgi:hypothetical protein
MSYIKGKKYGIYTAEIKADSIPTYKKVASNAELLKGDINKYNYILGNNLQELELEKLKQLAMEARYKKLNDYNQIINSLSDDLLKKGENISRSQLENRIRGLNISVNDLQSMRINLQTADEASIKDAIKTSLLKLVKKKDDKITKSDIEKIIKDATTTLSTEIQKIQLILPSSSSSGPTTPAKPRPTFTPIPTITPKPTPANPTPAPIPTITPKPTPANPTPAPTPANPTPANPTPANPTPANPTPTTPATSSTSTTTAPPPTYTPVREILEEMKYSTDIKTSIKTALDKSEPIMNHTTKPRVRVAFIAIFRSLLRHHYKAIYDIAMLTPSTPQYTLDKPQQQYLLTNIKQTITPLGKSIDQPTFDEVFTKEAGLWINESGLVNYSPFSSSSLSRQNVPVALINISGAGKKEKLLKIPFGRYLIDAKKLKKNILSITDKDKKKIHGLNNAVISDNLKKFFTKQKINSKKVNLTETEKIFLSNLLDRSEATFTKSKKQMIQNVGMANVSNIKDRLNLLIGSIDAGNNSPEIRQEVVDILNKLQFLGKLTKKQVNVFLKELN